MRRLVLSVIGLALVIGACAGESDARREKGVAAAEADPANPSAIAEASPTFDEFLAVKSMVTVEGYDLATWRLGDPNDPTVVMIHGVPTSSWMYRHVAWELADSGYDVVLVDNLGYGQSAKPASDPDEAAEIYRPEAQAKMILGTLEKLGVAQPIYVVHDLGGPVLWEMLEQLEGGSTTAGPVGPLTDDLAPSGLVVLNTIGAPGGFAPPASMDSSLVQGAMRIIGFESNAMLRSLFCDFAAQPESIDTPEILDGYFEPFAEGTDLSYYSFLANLSLVRDRLPGYSALLSRLDVPTAIVWGAQDENLLADPSVDWLSDSMSIPSERIQILPNVKHLVAEEAPDAVIRAIEQIAASIQ